MAAKVALTATSAMREMCTAAPHAGATVGAAQTAADTALAVWNGGQHVTVYEALRAAEAAARLAAFRASLARAAALAAAQPIAVRPRA